MIKKLRELPVENEDAFHNIDDDELAQGKVIRRMENLKQQFLSI